MASSSGKTISATPAGMPRITLPAPSNDVGICNDDSDTKSRIGDEYILVKKRPLDQKHDVKCSESALSSKMSVSLIGLDKPVLMRKPETVLRAMRAQGSKGRTLNAKLYVRVLTNSGANTALATSYALAPSASAEYSAFSGLFDEIKVNKIEVHFSTLVQNAGAFVGSASLLAMGYDSTYNTTPSSVVEVLESTQSMLVGIYGNGGTANNTVGPIASTPTGLHKFEIKVPKGPVANAAAVTGGTGIIANFPGEWMAVGDTADSVGYRRVYAAAQGTANSIVLEEVIVYHCSFRERT
jgi:hypothetical protein